VHIRFLFGITSQSVSIGVPPSARSHWLVAVVCLAIFSGPWRDVPSTIVAFDHRLSVISRRILRGNATSLLLRKSPSSRNRTSSIGVIDVAFSYHRRHIQRQPSCGSFLQSGAGHELYRYDDARAVTTGQPLLNDATETINLVNNSEFAFIVTELQRRLFAYACGGEDGHVAV